MRPIRRERRFGRLEISMTEENPAVLQAIYARCIPVRVEAMYYADTWEVTAWSEDFDALYLGEPVPEYSVIITETRLDDDSAPPEYSVEFKMVNP